MPASRRSRNGARRRAFPRLFWRLLVALILIYMAYDVLFSPQGWIAYRREAARVERLEREIATLKAERARLTRELQRLRNDPKAIEALIHRELGYVHPDETMVIVPGEAR